MRVTRGDHSFDVVDLDDEWGFWQRFADGRWEPETLDLVAKLAPGRTFVDIGAWVGAISLWAHAHGCGQLFAVECDPLAIPMLQTNLTENSVDHLLVKRAVWTHGDGIAMHPDGNSTTRVGEGDHAARTMTIPHLFDRWNIRDAVVKIDIEGAETPVLNAHHEVLAERGCELILSTHPWVQGPDCLSSDVWNWSRVEDWTFHLWPA